MILLYYKKVTIVALISTKRNMNISGYHYSSTIIFTMKIKLTLICISSLLIQLSLLGGLIGYCFTPIDLDVFQKHWIDQVNSLRGSSGLTGYTLDSGLSKAAQSWSEYSSSIGSISHSKFGSKLYYDYKLIQRYVEEQGVVFGSKPGTKVVENIGRGTVRCPKTGDCTSNLINATNTTWKFFVNEKGKQYAPHYKSMMSAHYTHAGFGVTIDHSLGKYYFTAYYSIPLSGYGAISITKPSVTKSHSFRTTKRLTIPKGP
ncbi:MAG TPA: CAP domain-containing protein [Candidatus Absconditabacterales bacterium]|nr:CAP domain-containing protein [Candidatus Absconditabacterales bacterium]